MSMRVARVDARHTSPCGLRHVDTQFPQFAVSTRGTPQRIRGSHVLNQSADVERHGRSAHSAMSRTPSPMDRKGTAVPAHDRGRLHDLDTPAPARPDSGEQHPQEPIGRSQVGPFRCGLLEDSELVSQAENLGFKLRPRPDTGANGSEERNQNGAHVRTTISAWGGSNTRRDTPYRISDNDTGGHEERSLRTTSLGARPVWDVMALTMNSRIDSTFPADRPGHLSSS